MSEYKRFCERGRHIVAPYDVEHCGLWWRYGVPLVGAVQWRIRTKEEDKFPRTPDTEIKR